MSRKMVGVVLAVVLLAASGTLAERRKGPTVVPPSVVYSGPVSKITTARYLRVDDETAWVKLWEEHTGKKVERSNINEPMDFPRVNFDTSMVVGCFKGAGYNSSGIYAVSIEETDDAVRLRFDEWSYQTFGPNGGGVKVAAYGLFVLPRSAKKVVIEENTQGMKDNPPVWTSRGEFAAGQGAARKGGAALPKAPAK